MSDDKVWLRHPDTGGHFHCPVEAVTAWQDLGWEVADEPPADPPSPVVAEHLAWREQHDAAQADPKPITRAARRGAQTGEMSDG